MGKTDIVKGFRDVEDARKRTELRRIIESVFELYGFMPVETPIIEYEEFVRGENSSDEAVSDIFKLKDKGGRKLALRYEFTFQLKRLAKNKKLPYRRYQIGPVFRDEPIGGSRWRQFTQCDVDIIGSSVRGEAEVLKLVSEIMGRLGIKAKIYLNNRKLLNEILGEIGVKEKDRDAVIREIDKLEKQPEGGVKKALKGYGAEKALGIFKKPEKYFEKYEAYGKIRDLRSACNQYGVKFEFQPFLARGLSYYNGTIFEIKSDIKETIAAGGSYMVAGNQATGISFGLDRLTLLSKLETENNQVLIISLNQDKAAVKLVNGLRSAKIPGIVFYGKPSKALDYANSYGIPYVVFVGADEVKKKKFKLKDMKSGKEKLVSEKNLLKGLVLS